MSNAIDLTAMHLAPADEDTLGGRIARARDLAAMSLEDAAARLGVTAETYAEWENDRSEPRANKLPMVAGVFGVSAAWLLSGAGEEPETSALKAGLAEMTDDLDRLKALSGEIAEGIALLETRIETVRRAAG